MLHVDQLSSFSPEITASSVTLPHFNFCLPVETVQRRSRKCPRRDTARRVLQTKGFQVTETSRSSCRLNELRTVLKMKERHNDEGRGKDGGSIGEGERKGKPLDVEATRQPEYGWKDGKGCEKEERRPAIRPTEGQRIERQYSQQQTRQIAR